MLQKAVWVLATCMVASMAHAQSPALGSMPIVIHPPGANVQAFDFTATPATPIQLPADGIIRATTFRVRPGVTLRFAKNARNTPVYILATGEVLIEGTIDVSGKEGLIDPPVAAGVGGPGGFDGGLPAFAGIPAGPGQGPGGGPAGALIAGAFAGRAQSCPANNFEPVPRTYGSPELFPLIGGSGSGGALNPGGGGGGAVMLASNLRVSFGSVGTLNARGGVSGCSGASGGGIRVVAPTVAGPIGRLLAEGPSCGRVRIDAIERRALTGTANANNFNCSAFVSFGKNLAVFPPTEPKVEIIQASGTTITPGVPVSFTLPLGTPNPQTVVVRVSGFPGNVAVQLAGIPTEGTSQILPPPQTTNNINSPVDLTFQIDIPPNNLTTLQVWANPVP
jgi:hypothetical protein